MDIIERILLYTLYLVLGLIGIIVIFMIGTFLNNYNCEPDIISITSIQELPQDPFILGLQKNTVIHYKNSTEYGNITFYYDSDVEELRETYNISKTYVLNWCQEGEYKILRGIIEYDWGTRLFYKTIGKNI